jgi:hypothetical protein
MAAPVRGLPVRRRQAPLAAPSRERPADRLQTESFDSKHAAQQAADTVTQTAASREIVDADS